MVLAGSHSTTIRVVVPQATDPIAATQIYVPSGYGVNISQPADTSIGTVDATAYSRDAGLTLPLSGTVATADPAELHGAVDRLRRHADEPGGLDPHPDHCDHHARGPAVRQPDRRGAEAALGAYKLSICLPPPDVPVGDPSPRGQGAQLLDAIFTVNGIFTTPTGGGLLKWDALFTPYNPGKGTPNTAGTFEARAFVPLPIILNLQVVRTRRRRRRTALTGRMSERRLPAPGLTVAIPAGPSAKSAEDGPASAKTGTSRDVQAERKAEAEEDDVLPGKRVRRRGATTRRQGCKTPSSRSLRQVA